MKLKINSWLGMFLLIITACTGQEKHSKGILFIIGGGEKSDRMMHELADLAGIRNNGYLYILPMASSVPDSALLWTREDFAAAGIMITPGHNFVPGEIPSKAQLDSIENAKLIFISGGDQSKFMDAVKNTLIPDAILNAYDKGAIISGTSAGAAVMSKKMITGNQKKHPDAEGGFITIESENIEIKEGLGLLNNVIIDQHFIKRQRLNRLIAAAIENPEQICVGIDESTAIIVRGNTATVTGEGQVVVIKNLKGVKILQDGLLGTEGLQLSIYLPRQSFSLIK